MTFLTFDECANWCQARGYPVNVDPYGHQRPNLEPAFAPIELPYPVDSGKKVYVARRIVEWSLDQGAVLLWIHDWDVWPSCQHMPLFTRFREALGERRPLIETPGHLVDTTDLDDAVSVLVTALIFMWDCYVFRANSGPVYFCSHDEWNAAFVPPGQSTDQIGRELQALLGYEDKDLST